MTVNKLDKMDRGGRGLSSLSDLIRGRLCRGLRRRRPRLARCLPAQEEASEPPPLGGASGAVLNKCDDRISAAVMPSWPCWLCSEALENLEDVSAQGGPNRLMHNKCWNGWKCLKRICETNSRMEALIAELMRKQ